MKPILFNTPMTRAVAENRKTATRRIAYINTEITCNDGTTNHEFVLDSFSGMPTPSGFVCRKCGFGVAPPHSRVPCGTSLFRPRYWPGDILYVRETWAKMVDLGTISHAGYVYRGDYNDNELQEMAEKHFTWKPSIHMPKEAARIFICVTDVRVERLQAMTEEDAEAEGCVGCPYEHTVYFPEGGLEMCVNVPGRCRAYPEHWYCNHSLPEIFGRDIWDKTIKPADLYTCGWDANPWVWVYEFERCEKPKEG